LRRHSTRIARRSYDGTVNVRRSCRLCPLALLLGVLIGCSADRPLNPSFPLTVAQAREALRQMRADPKPLQRPVLVLSGIHDPGLVVSSVANRLRGITTDDAKIQTVSFFGADTFDACRKRVLDKADALAADRGDSGDVEIDVVAVSMGGLVARYAAMPRAEDDRSLRIKRLFTISSPHRGASMAGLPTFDRRIIDMRPGSAFLANLDAATEEADYELIPYVRLGDAIVGQENAAPPGRQAWWVATGPLSLAHISAYDDLRIIADIARHLRGEEPFTRSPPAEMPKTTATSAEP